MYSRHDLLITLCASRGAARCDSHGASRTVPCMLGRGEPTQWRNVDGWVEGCEAGMFGWRVEVGVDGWMDRGGWDAQTGKIEVVRWTERAKIDGQTQGDINGRI